MRKLLLLAGLLSVSNAAFSAIIVFDGNLPEDLKKGKFKIALTIEGVTADAVSRGSSDPVDDQQQFKGRVSIILPDVDASSEIPVLGDATTPNHASFAMREFRKHTETQHSDSTRSYRYFVEISELTAGALADNATNRSLKLSALFYLGGRTPMNLIAQVDHINVVTEAALQDTPPPEIGVVSARGHLDFMWPADSASSKKWPDDMHIIVINATTGKELSLPAIKISRTPGLPNENTTCSYHAGAGYCMICGNHTYLDIDTLRTKDGILVIEAKSASGLVKSGTLPAGKYFFMTQFAPEGIVQGECEQAFVY